MTPVLPASPAVTAAALASILAGHGLTRTYVAARPGIAVISVTAGLTAWTDGRQLWITRAGQQETWPAADTRTAAARLAALARHDVPLPALPDHRRRASGSDDSLITAPARHARVTAPPGRLVTLRVLADAR